MHLRLTVSLASLVLASVSVAEPLALTVHSDRSTQQISPGLYGQFLEHIFNSVHGGLWGDQILNGTFELAPPSRRRRVPASTEAPAAPVPLNWEFVGGADEVFVDRENPFNAEVSIRLAAKTEDATAHSPAIRQGNIALIAGESYTLSLYLRGRGSAAVTLTDGEATVFSTTYSDLSIDWRRFVVEFTASRTVHAAMLTISSASAGPVNVDQVTLFSAAALAAGGYRPDLLKAIADLRPASIRWPGGSFASLYVWQNGVGPRERRLPHPSVQWGDRDPYQFGTDEFLQFCEKVGAEPILVINTTRGIEDALDWLEYCMGDVSTRYGRQRAANGHPAPYELRTVEIDNETWHMGFPGYLDIVQRFCPAIRARYPDLKLSVVGSYGYDTGPGQNQETDWDPRLIEQAGAVFDILSPHYYNGIYSVADYVEDPRRYEQFLKRRGEIIRRSANPDMKIYVSEWNLTDSAHKWGNDWRVGLYAGGILNGFERQSDFVTMSCPALFLRRHGITHEWDNALINFDQSSWYPGATYVVMKLWHDAFAPRLLAVDGPERPLNFVATRSADGKTVFLKAVNPTPESVEAAVRLDGDFVPAGATVQLVAPGSETVKNSLDQPDAIKVVPAAATVDGRTVRFTLPPLSAGVVRVSS